MFNLIVQFINKVTERLTMTFMAVMVFLVMLQIILRSTLSLSFSWPEEIARFLLIWIVFLGAGFAFQYGSHISIDIVMSRLSKSLKRTFQVLIVILCSTFLLIVIVQGMDLSQRTMMQSSPSLNIPMGYVYMVIPISGILQILNLVHLTINIFKTDEYPGEV